MLTSQLPQASPEWIFMKCLHLHFLPKKRENKTSPQIYDDYYWKRLWELWREIAVEINF
jgi:hypothetical protein